MRGALSTRIKIATKIADNPKSADSDRIRALDFLARYGVGSMTTGTLDVTHRTIDDVLLERARRRGLIAG
jgi:hypothetical protein